MTSRPDFEDSCALMRELGIRLDEARSMPEHFRSWFIRGTRHGKSLRVVWDGRDDRLIVQEPSLSGTAGNWDDRWIADNAFKHKPSELREGLLGVLSG